jgi:hypothetical protein
VNDASVIPDKGENAFSNRRLSLEIFIAGRSGMMIFRCLAFHFRVVVMHPTLVTCNNAVQKIIKLAFKASNS